MAGTRAPRCSSAGRLGFVAAVVMDKSRKVASDTGPNAPSLNILSDWPNGCDGQLQFTSRAPLVDLNFRSTQARTFCCKTHLWRCIGMLYAAVSITGFDGTRARCEPASNRSLVAPLARSMPFQAGRLHCRQNCRYLLTELRLQRRQCAGNKETQSASQSINSRHLIAALEIWNEKVLDYERSCDCSRKQHHHPAQRPQCSTFNACAPPKFKAAKRLKVN